VRGHCDRGLRFPKVPRRDDDGAELAQQCALYGLICCTALGRPTQAIEGTEGEGPVKHTLFVRWLPPDPNDRSRVIEPEP
jgi:hypothetical protein